MSKRENKLKLDLILSEIKAGITGNPKIDIIYLETKKEFYKGHELGRKIIYHCNKMIHNIMPWERYSEEIKEYCLQNNLSYSKLMKMGKQYGKDNMFFCYIKRERIEEMTDECLNIKPPLVLTVDYSNPDNLRFEQTEDTRKYLTERC